ncbi:MAG TPA: competence/damage-inducible protein A, partial [Fimbriimonadaceae bacterium]|nr:competence/damage-inducible protein A [Fimbriimonadaceae bacterium]
LGQIADTNAQELGKLFPELGIRHLHRQTVGDNLERLTEALRLALSRSDLVVTIGGLGPTEDDLTRDGIAAALGEEMELDKAIESDLQRFFAERNIAWVSSQSRQAMRPPSCRAIPNPNGTAPGLVCEKDGKIVIAMPGPKGEFVPMMNGPVREFLQGLVSDGVIHSRILRVCGMGESAVEERVRHLMHGSNPSVAPYAHVGEVHLRLTASAGSTQEADGLLDPLEEQIRSALEGAVYGTGDTALEMALTRELEDRKKTVSVAESITGGGLGQRFSGVPGSSGVFIGGMITYTPEMKQSLLGISKELLEEHGPVSAECARAMASAAREKTGATYGISLTGNAGPTSDVDGKPVGLVFVAVAGPAGVEVREHHFRGQREDIRRRSSQAALVLLREVLLQPSS